MSMPYPSKRQQHQLINAIKANDPIRVKRALAVWDLATQGMDLFFTACYTGKDQAIAAMLPHLDKVRPDFLIVAIENNRLAVVKLLLAHAQSQEEALADMAESSALIDAARSGQGAILDHLLTEPALLQAWLKRCPEGALPQTVARRGAGHPVRRTQGSRTRPPLSRRLRSAGALVKVGPCPPS